MNNFLKFSLALVIALTSTLSFGQKKEKGPININKKGLAIKGYDVVSYFNGTPKKGKAKISAKHDNATYLFATKENLATFKKEPNKYLPQYGGYCAYAVGKGYKYTVNPLHYTLEDNKLYLFFGNPGGKTSKNWEEKNLKPKADKNWKTLK